VLSNLSGKRNRGALAYLQDRIKKGAIPKKAVDHLHQDLESLLTLDNNKDVLASAPAFNDYQKFFKINVFQLWQQLITKSAGKIPWGSTVTEAYYSQAEGTGVLFAIHLPPAIDQQESLPMLVVAKKGPRVKPSAEFPFIEVKPSLRGIWGYRSISAYDMMQVIGFMKQHYPVDSNRVYLAGSSAGASGAMQLASTYPSEFAAVLPLVAVGTNYPLLNFKNLPVTIHHGVNDWTSSICNARVQAQRMQKLGCPVTLKEYPSGHSIPGSHKPLMEWMMNQKRNPSPQSLSHQCETPSLGRSYWAHIREFQDPHQNATLEASVNDSDGRGKVIIHPKNIQAFTLYPHLMPSVKAGIKTAEIGKTQLSLEGSTKRLDFRFRNDRWILDAERITDIPTKRPYHAGAAANLYQGEPLVIVYGTQSSDKNINSKLVASARKLSACGGPAPYLMSGRFPIVADSDLSPEQQANCNLILLGTPTENSVTQSIIGDLPITIRDRTLMVAERPALPLKNQVISLLYPHPQHPQRLVYILAPFTDSDGLTRFSKSPQSFLAGSDGFNRISQADLLVQNLNHQIGRQMQFGKDWDWVIYPGADNPIPDRYSDRSDLALSHFKVMQKNSKADFAFWWGPSDKGMWGTDFNFLKSYQPDFYTQADFQTQHHLAETMTGGLSGMEIKEIWKQWGQNQQLLMAPKIQINTLDDKKQYRVNIPMNLYIKLGQRKKNLDDPKSGPGIAPEEIMAEIFPTDK